MNRCERQATAADGERCYTDGWKGNGDRLLFLTLTWTNGGRTLGVWSTVRMLVTFSPRDTERIHGSRVAGPALLGFLADGGYLVAESLVTTAQHVIRLLDLRQRGFEGIDARLIRQSSWLRGSRATPARNREASGSWMDQAA